MMNFTVTGRHLVVSDAVHDHVQKKLAHLHRVLNDSAVSAQCVISQQRQQFVCELTLHVRGDHTLVAIGRHVRAATAVSLAADKVGQQAQRLADKWKTHRRRTSAPEAASVEPVAPEPGVRVIRSRRYAVKPMTVDDAVLALDAGGQAFVVFRHVSSDAVAVVYRRPDGHVGLIDTGA